MRYTLEIQKLLLQTQNNNLHPREKANLLKEAIRIADENEDVEWATELNSISNSPPSPYGKDS